MYTNRNDNEELHDHDCKCHDTYCPAREQRDERESSSDREWASRWDARGPRCALRWEARISSSSVARTKERAGRNGPSHDEASPWWGVSRGLSGDFMYITIPQAGTRAVHCWLTGRRSRWGRELFAPSVKGKRVWLERRKKDVLLFSIFVNIVVCNIVVLLLRLRVKAVSTHTTWTSRNRPSNCTNRSNGIQFSDHDPGWSSSRGASLSSSRFS